MGRANHAALLLTQPLMLSYRLCIPFRASPRNDDQKAAQWEDNIPRYNPDNRP